MKSFAAILSLLTVALLQPSAGDVAASKESAMAISSTNPHLKVRSALPNVARAIDEGKCHVAFLGGSITENKGGHSAMVPASLRAIHPDTEFAVTNAGLSSTCSTSGAFRLGSHVFSKGPVDLMIVEFAVNDDQDAAYARRECVRGMEGIVRQVRREHPTCDILMVHYVNPSMLAKIQTGETPLSIEAHESVAERYGVISVNVAAEIASQVKTGKYAWEDYGGTHPKAFGYRVASNMILEAIRQGMASTPADAQELPELPEPLDADSYVAGAFVSPDKAERAGGWRLGKVGRDLLPVGSIRSQYKSYDLLRGDAAGDELKLAFEGRAVGAFILAGPDAGQVETSIDGGEFQTHELYHRFSGGLNYPRSVIFASGLDAGKHELTLRIAGTDHEKSKGTSASILFFEVNR